MPSCVCGCVCFRRQFQQPSHPSCPLIRTQTLEVMGHTRKGTHTQAGVESGRRVLAPTRRWGIAKPSRRQRRRRRCCQGKGGGESRSRREAGDGRHHSRRRSMRQLSVNCRSFVLSAANQQSARRVFVCVCGNRQREREGEERSQGDPRIKRPKVAEGE